MEVLLRLGGMVAYQLLIMLLQPLFWLVVAIIWFQFNRIAKMKSQFFHVPIESVWHHTFRVIFLGMFGGLIGSTMLVLAGVSITEIGLEYLWIFAIILMLINQRMMCFAYGGGLLGILAYFFAWPQANIAQLMTLVAVLHFVEAILILLSGHIGAMPVYIKGKDGRLTGGFSMMKFWPLPIVALVATAVGVNQPAGIEYLAMPQWWPIIPSDYLQQPMLNIVYSLTPVVAALGYSDLALTEDPRRKTRTSAKHLAFYSIILLALALLGGKIPQLAIVAAVFAPLGHEWIIRLGQKNEVNGRYIYRNPLNGVMVLDVLYKHPAYLAGLKSRDVILRINGEEVQKPMDVERIVEQSGMQMAIDYKRNKKIRSTQVYIAHSRASLGLILAPEPFGVEYMDIKNNSSLGKNLIKKMRKCFAREA